MKKFAMFRLWWWFCGALVALGFAHPGAAYAANYTFPGSLPAGCSGSGTAYTCGALTLASGDTVAVSNASTTITFTSLSTNNAQINAAGTANLTLTVSGTMTVASGAVIKANITAGSVSSAGAVTYVGSLTTTTSGAITLGAGTTVSGALTTVTGAITLNTGTAMNYTTVGSINSGGTVTINSYNRVNGPVVGYLLSAAGNNTINGSITSTTTYVSLGGNATVNGSIYAQTYVDTGGGSNITGSITSATSYIDTGAATTVGGSLSALGTYVDIHGSASIGGGIYAKSYVSMTTGSTVGGNVTANTTIAMGSGSTVSQCVRSKNASTITVPSAGAVGGACCGSGSTCTNTCVSGSPKPAACSWPQSGLVAEYRFEESSYNGTEGEVLDSSGNKRHGKMQGAVTSTASGKICRGMQVPNNTTSSVAAFDTGIDVNTIGDSGTVAFWYKSVTSGSEHRMLFDATALASGKFYLYRDDDGSGVDLNAYITDGGGTDRDVDKLNAFSDATWVHIAITWKVLVGSSASRLRLYVGGVQQDEQTYTIASGVINSAISTLYFGDNRSASSPELNSANGTIDQVKLYDAELTAAEVAALVTESPTCAQATLIAKYTMDESSWTGAAGELTDTAGYSGGPFNGKAQTTLPVSSYSTPARSGSVGTCRYANVGGGQSELAPFTVSGLPVSTANGNQTSVAFWMYWNGNNNDMVMSWATYDLWFSSGHFGFNTQNSDIHGISSSGLSGGWHHVVAIFTNGSVTSNQLYIDGVLQTLTQRTGTPDLAKAVVSSAMQVGGSWASAFRFRGLLDEVRVYNNALSATEVAALYAETRTCSSWIDHLEIRHGSGSGLSCTPSTLTVMACQDAACNTPYTGGVTGTLTATGSGMTVNWPSTANFSIGSGSSSTTVSMHQTTVGSVVLGTSGLSIATSSASSCNFGSPSCTFTTANSGLIFDVPNHVSDVAYSVSVSAVRSSDNGAVCTPAFASVSKSVNFKCTYTNPSTGTLPVRVGGAALNAANNSAAACDGTGRSVSLSFNGSGVASTTVQYADVGLMGLSATYTGSGSDAGLVMTGSDTFIAAPSIFTVSGVTAGNIVAGQSFSATVSAKNYSNANTPNFGKETVPEGATLGFVRATPTGSGASNGVFSGSLGSFNLGSATASNLVWSEVGRGDVTAALTSGSYLGSGLTAAGSTAGAMVYCSAQLSWCTLPTGATGTIYYGAAGRFYMMAGRTGSTQCFNGNFGDPYPGYVAKTCSYVVTSGAAPATVGAVGPFIPHHFTVSGITQGCSAGSFTYSGQPFGATITAYNASNSITTNYDGTANTSPNFAKAVTLSAASNGGTGSMGNATVAASSFASGVATLAAASSTSPTFTFTNKLTTATSITVRATDTDAVSSSGYSEGSVALRSGRLKFSNAFGSEKVALDIPVQAQYWSGKAWVLNSADSCTNILATAIAKSNYLNHLGATLTGWSTAASAVTLSSGAGTLTMSAPSPASPGSVDIAINLGSTTADNACMGSHPATTGAGLSWLRSLNGNCAATYDRDPSARITFGIYSPENKRTVHVRQLY